MWPFVSHTKVGRAHNSIYCKIPVEDGLEQERVPCYISLLEDARCRYPTQSTEKHGEASIAESLLNVEGRHLLPNKSEPILGLS